MDATSYWPQVGTWGEWFSAIVSSTVLLYAVFQDLWKRPKLFADFDNARDVKSQENTIGLGPEDRSRWLRVAVKNSNRRKAAKNSRAFLIGVKREGPGPAEEFFSNDVRQLRWMHGPLGGALARDLLPGVVHWVDVVHTIDKESTLKMCVYPPYSLGVPGIYLFKIQVSAEDVDPIVVNVRIHWDGEWDSLRGEQVR